MKWRGENWAFRQLEERILRKLQQKSEKGVNRNWGSELTVTWPLRDPEPTFREVSPPSCGLLAFRGGGRARYSPEGGRACSPGKEEVVEANPDPWQEAGEQAVSDGGGVPEEGMASLHPQSILEPEMLGCGGLVWGPALYCEADC
ncbi:protein BEX5 isoform X3 [Choloepus didactylus]|uniref:protein BEX5 isoform X3 n=1 Tax=Choloepus didactylus TaxID=27675 RepID=UPI00189F2BCC|nr:protein BEX5 isoform X3 [Choloepus didactylus]